MNQNRVVWAGILNTVEIEEAISNLAEQTFDAANGWPAWANVSIIRVAGIFLADQQTL